MNVNQYVNDINCDHGFICTQMDEVIILCYTN